MHAESTKNRGWVKNAVIIFLSVMLALTFFSNTIMNRSLPEVATQIANSGTITTRVRGSANIEAAEVYEVKTQDTRKVESVLVKEGQTVEVGDPLIILEKGDSSELESAKVNLDSANYSYQTKLINMSDTDGSTETQRAGEKLAEAQTTLAMCTYVSPVMVSSAKSDYDAKLAVENEKKAAYEKAAAALEAAGGYSPGTNGPDGYDMNTALTEYNALKIQYENEYNLITKLAEIAHGVSSSRSITAYAKAISNAFMDRGTDGASTLPITIEQYFDPATADDSIIQERRNLNISTVDITDATFAPLIGRLSNHTLFSISSAYNQIDAAYDKYLKASNSYYDDLQSSHGQNSGLKYTVDSAKSAYTKAQSATTAAKTYYDNLTTQKTAYETARQAVYDCQDNLEKALKTGKLDDLELKKLQTDVYRAQAKVSDLTKTGAGGEITSTVHGVVREVTVTAGDTAQPDATLLKVEVPDRGYTVSITVTKDQAKKVTIGDTAEVSTGYWGAATLSGKLINIKTDPKAQNSKLLVFELSGQDIETGSQVSVSIGQKSQSFDVIVPNSSIRSDSNGKFVYVVTSRSSPLGTRYIATRVDVQVTAADDTNSAVTGGVAKGDYVITTSNKPIEKGTQVRIAD